MGNSGGPFALAPVIVLGRSPSTFHWLIGSVVHIRSLHTRFFRLRCFREEAIGLHPIQRKAPGKVAGNLVENGAAFLSSLPDHVSFHSAPESRKPPRRLRRFAAVRALELIADFRVLG